MHVIKTVLALGAHPDDLELGCGATIAKLCAAGAVVHAVVFSEGKKGAAEGSDRAAESRAALESLGVVTVTQHQFEDTRLHERLNDLIEVTERHVRELRPDRVYTMFHLELSATGTILRAPSSTGPASDSDWCSKASSDRRSRNCQRSSRKGPSEPSPPHRRSLRGSSSKLGFIAAERASREDSNDKCF